jgi:hypothetical protein
MATLRCTAKLRKRLGIAGSGKPQAPLNALGDWYANILFTRSGHYVIVESERSRLPVLVSARDLPNFPSRFLQTLSEVLDDLGVPTHQIEREVEAMHPLHFGKTMNKSVLGTLNDHAFLAKLWLAPGDLSIYDVTLRLAEVPCQPLESKFPYKETRKLLANPRKFEVIDGDA